MAEKRWVGTYVDEGTHDAIRNLATYRGTHPTTVLADLIERGLAEVAEEKGMPDELKLYALAYKADQDQVIEQQLERIAWLATKKQDEELVDKLEALCSYHGYSIDDIMDKASNYKQPPIIVGKNSTGKQAAKRWLQDRFTEQQEWSVRHIRDELGEKAGFSRVMLNRAKRELGVVSERKSLNWVWVLPEDEQLKEHTP